MDEASPDHSPTCTACQGFVPVLVPALLHTGIVVEKKWANRARKIGRHQLNKGNNSANQSRITVPMADFSRWPIQSCCRVHKLLKLLLLLLLLLSLLAAVYPSELLPPLSSHTLLASSSIQSHSRAQEFGCDK